MRHAMIKVAVWVAVCGMIDANTDYYTLFAHSVQGCLSATGLLNGSNGGSFVHWLKETPTPDFSKQERQSGCGSRRGDGAHQSGARTPVCRPEEDGGDFTMGTSRQDLGYDGP